MLKFCKLSHDEKTFNYFKNYVECLEKKDRSFFNVDQEIQEEEIRNHLIFKGFLDGNEEEGIRWIEEYGKSFRNYLNTIKLVYLVWHCMEKPWILITWEEFCHLEDKINEVKDICLDKIF